MEPSRFKPGVSDAKLEFENKPWIYIASPYTQGDRSFNVYRQLEAKLKLFELGVVPIDPVPNSDMFHETFCEMSYETWINYTAELASRCDGMLRLAGKSSGADGEVTLALTKFGYPVFYDYTMLTEALTYWDAKEKYWDMPCTISDKYLQFRTFDTIITP